MYLMKLDKIRRKYYIIQLIANKNINKDKFLIFTYDKEGKRKFI